MRRRKPSKPKACPDCGRAGPECWRMPCLGLQTILEKKDQAAIDAWCAAVAFPGRVEFKKDA